MKPLIGTQVLIVKHGANNMKKINQLFILPLLALSLFNVNNTQLTNSQFQLEETTNDKNIVGIRKEITSTSNNDVKVSNILKVQASNEENGKRSLRFVAGISSLSLNAHFHRDEIKVNDEVIMKANDIDVTCAYSKILNGTVEQTANEVFGNEYNYFIAYTLKDIPEDYWSTVINVSLVVGDSNRVATKKANVDAFDESKTNKECFSFSKLNDGNYAIAMKNDYKATITELNIPSYYYETIDTNNEFVKTKNMITTIGYTLKDPFSILSFNGCTKLTYINFPSTITKINDQAFYGCSSLITVVFNSGVNIGHYAFFSCNKIEQLILPKETVFGEAPFGDHHENLSIYYEGETIPTSWNESWNFESSFKFYLFSSTQPTSKPTNADGYWHYENNKPVTWKISTIESK